MLCTKLLMENIVPVYKRERSVRKYKNTQVADRGS